MDTTDIYNNYWNEKIITEKDYPEYLNPGGKHHILKTLSCILPSLQKNAKVLDIGCGSGFTTYFYYPFCKEIYALDYSREAIKKAKQDYPNIHFIEGNITALPFKDKEFDIIICSGVLHHLIKPTITYSKSSKYVYNAIAEIDRVGKGVILIDEANALNPIRKYKEKTYYKKINRNEESYTLHTWKKIFGEFGYKITDYEYHTFIPTSFSEKMIKLTKPIETILETIPLINKIAGGIFFKCEKKK